MQSETLRASLGPPEAENHRAGGRRKDVGFESTRPPACTRGTTAKRTFDILCCAVGLLLFGLPMALIAILIRLDSKGPVFFRQKRLGRNNVPFSIWKFRTMEVDAEQRRNSLLHLNQVVGGGTFKIQNDPRITRVGKYLRQSSLDELPQLFNVLAGTMSIVGPRPLPICDCDELRMLHPELFECRSAVLPGLTGPWQVGGRSHLDSKQMLELDAAYAMHSSMATDLRVILKTVVVVLSRCGAY